MAVLRSPEETYIAATIFVVTVTEFSHVDAAREDVEKTLLQERIEGSVRAYKYVEIERIGDMLGYHDEELEWKVQERHGGDEERVEVRRMKEARCGTDAIAVSPMRLLQLAEMIWLVNWCTAGRMHSQPTLSLDWSRAASRRLRRRESASLQIFSQQTTSWRSAERLWEPCWEKRRAGRCMMLARLMSFPRRLRRLLSGVPA